MRISDYIAVALFVQAHDRLQHMEGNELFISAKGAVEDVAEALNISTAYITEEDVNRAIQALADEGLVAIFRTPHAAPRYLISWDKTRNVDRTAGQDTDGFRGALWLFNRLGQDWLRESFTGALSDPSAAPQDEENSGLLDLKIPASDRYVTKSDNEELLNNAADGAKLLEEALRGDNDVDAEIRQIALSEVAAFEASLIQPRVPLDLIERFARKFLKWLLLVFSGEAVKMAAKALIELLLPLLSSAS